MATAATTSAGPPGKLSIKPDTFDRVLASGSLILLAALVTAVARGRAEWPDIPTIVWAHIATIFIAVTLTPVMLLRRRGDWIHRRLGWLWAVSLAMTAILSFGIRGINQGSFSLIHVLSAWTLIQVPLVVWHARRHNHAKHRSAVRGMVIGALLIAGFFTFPFGRLMGRWLLGA